MVRKIVGVLIGTAVLVAMSLLIDGAATAMFHLNGLDHADMDHPHAALAMGGIIMFAAGTLLGGLAGAYAAVRIGWWAAAAWIIAVAGAFDAFSAAGLFANRGTVFAASLVTMALGCWLGARLAVRSVGAPAPKA